MKYPPIYIVPRGSKIELETLKNMSGSIITFDNNSTIITNENMLKSYSQWIKEETLKININTNVNKLIDD